MTVLICPGCKGPKSRRARLCAGCRRQANAVGADVLTHVSAAAAPQRPAAVPVRTPGQNRAYHGKCAALAELRGELAYDVKRQALARAAKVTRRQLESSKDLDELEMSDLLDWLDGEIAASSAGDG